MTGGVDRRKLATRMGLGLGGVAAAGGSAVGVLFAEARLARRQIGNADHDPPAPSGWYGQGRPGPAIKLALLGDSSAAGYGVDTVEETPGAYLASGVAEAADRRVYLSSVAKVGAQTKDLAAQIDRVLPMEPHLAVIFIGGNDVTHLVSVRTSQRLLRSAVTRLTSRGITVVVGTCPDLGTIRPLPPPLRQVARTWSRQLAAAQATTVVQCEARAVALGSLLTDEFSSFADLLFGPDQFHPSAAGYARMSAAVLPTVVAALGLSPDDEEPEWDRGEAVLPIDIAVLEAARQPGTSVEPVPDAEQTAGPARFATLRHRRHQPETDIEAPSADEGSVRPVEGG